MMYMVILVCNLLKGRRADSSSSSFLGVNPAQKKHLDCYQGVIKLKTLESASRIKGLTSPTL